MTLLLRIGLSCILLLQSLTAVYGAAALDEKCLDMVQELMSSQLGHIVPCINELGLTTPKERGANYNCIMKCVLARAETLTPEGRISVMRAVSFILEKIPNEYIEKALTEIAKCQEYANIDVGDPNDKGCTKMRPLVACGIDFIFNICKV
ncbi:uncharacterized protein LOC110842085 [Folsomia candida]|uniref:Uncharacterized protein n=1 Tax=Folsomia candida TaxID=158441 RepID=A0A226F4M4_FOLCA|nr:uncharacterized protein LOC110842085 [Folsomia candida]OXA64398.1 hypothetical protein Fcan01_03381 [Folsomia candida]